MILPLNFFYFTIKRFKTYQMFFSHVLWFSAVNSRALKCFRSFEQLSYSFELLHPNKNYNHPRPQNMYGKKEFNIFSYQEDYLTGRTFFPGWCRDLSKVVTKNCWSFHGCSVQFKEMLVRRYFCFCRKALLS